MELALHEGYNPDAATPYISCAVPQNMHVWCDKVLQTPLVSCSLCSSEIVDTNSAGGDSDRHAKRISRCSMRCFEAHFVRKRGSTSVPDCAAHRFNRKTIVILEVLYGDSYHTLR